MCLASRAAKGAYALVVGVDATPLPQLSRLRGVTVTVSLWRACVNAFVLCCLLLARCIRDADWASFYAVFESVADGTSYSTAVRPDAVVEVGVDAGPALGVCFVEFKTASQARKDKRDWCVAMVCLHGSAHVSLVVLVDWAGGR
jgi:hypothetical protein